MEQYYKDQRTRIELNFNDIALLDTMKNVEKEHWNYLDNYCAKNKWMYPRMNFYQFLDKLLEKEINIGHSRSVKKYCQIYNKYKKSLPTAGAVIIYDDNILLVRIYGSKVYSMPKGKSDPGETLKNTAIREVEEETGLDLQSVIDNEEVDEIIIHKTKFYIVQSDYRIRSFYGYNKNEITDIKWFSKLDVFKKPNKFSKQVKATLKKLETMNLI
jgi:mRNA-decapping enzyme subunit 2